MVLSPFRPTLLAANDAAFPACLKKLFEERGKKRLSVIGETHMLGEPSIGLICSVHCPGTIVLQTYDYFQRLKLNRQTVIGGFHAPMERECLRILLSGRSPVIICSARSIDRMRIRADWKPFIVTGRLSVLSAFGGKQRRSTVRMAEERNRIVAVLADEVLIPYAAPGSKTERLAREILQWKKTVRTFSSLDNASLLSMGALPVTWAGAGEVGR